jgi:serine/threonine protein kinase
MPWIEGTTWQEIVMAKQSLFPQKSITIARDFCRILVSLEQKSIAHGDLSPSNIIISHQQDQIELVDVEGMYAPTLSLPEALTAGSPGYAHKSNTTGIWEPTADRFAGAIILAEMLMAASPEFGSLSYGESFFSPKEIQTDCHRYQKVEQTLRTSYGNEIADLFNTAWQSSTINDCPSFAQWQNILCSINESAQPILTDLSQRTEAEGNITVGKWKLAHEVSSLPETENRKDQAHSKAGELPPKIIPPIPPAISYPSEETKKLFDTGYWAYQHQNWFEADRALGIVVSRNPDFALYGVRADTLLAQAKFNTQYKPIKKKTPVFLWVNLGLVAFVLLIILITWFLNSF